MNIHRKTTRILRVTALAGIAILFSALFAATVRAEPAALREKAAAYLERLREEHLPGFGGVVQVVYEAPDLQNLFFYKGQGDSTMHTGLYLSAECFRYAVTGDADARSNAIDAVRTLRDHLRVTGVPGYIGRYVGPIETPYLLDYFQSDILRFAEGEYLGNFYLSNTSSDQYVGWFFGLAIAYDLLDDEPTRELIRDMIREVIDRLRNNFWLIITEEGLPSTAAPNISGAERMAFLLIAAHVLADDPFYQELYEERFEAAQPTYRLNSISFFNKYTEYFAFNLKHMNYYNIFRLETDPSRRAFYRDVFTQMIRPLVAWTHNVFFDFVWLTVIEEGFQGEDVGAVISDDLHTLEVFQSPPNRDIHIDAPLLPIDPISTFLKDLSEALGLQDILQFKEQTATPHRIEDRCRREYLWQRTPYDLFCVGFFDQHVFPGVDYLIAYWMGAYHDTLEPPDDTDDDLDDDDTGFLPDDDQDDWLPPDDDSDSDDDPSTDADQAGDGDADSANDDAGACGCGPSP